MRFLVPLVASPVLGPRPPHAEATQRSVSKDVASLVVAGLGPDACQYAPINFSGAPYVWAFVGFDGARLRWPKAR